LLFSPKTTQALHNRQPNRKSLPDLNYNSFSPTIKQLFSVKSPFGRNVSNTLFLAVIEANKNDFDTELEKMFGENEVK
jgi:hypothetical protein